ncbi:hypothetical protein Tco_1508038 [Tanacetum coccineum]
MFEDHSYEAHEDHKNLFEALQKSLEHDYSNQLLEDLEEARGKKRKRRDSPRTPSGSPLQPPPAGASGAPGSGALSSSKIVTSTIQSMAWTTSDTRYESAVLLSDDEDTGNDHLPKADMRKDWWKPLHEEERPATPKPVWTIPSSDMSDVYEVVKAFYPNVIHLQFQMEECHKMLTNQVNWVNPEGDQVRINVSRPLPLGGPPSHVTIQTQFFFNKDLEYLRYGNKGSMPELSISKMKAARYPDFGLELLVPEQMWSDEVCTEVRKHMRILSVVRIKAYSRYGYDYLSKIVLRRADFQEYKITEKDFKNLYPSDFKDLNLLLLQGHLDHLPSWAYAFHQDKASSVKVPVANVTLFSSAHLTTFPVFTEGVPVGRVPVTPGKIQALAIIAA